MHCGAVEGLQYRSGRRFALVDGHAPKVPMLPQDPMTWIIMIGNLAVLIALLLLIRNRRAS